MAMTRYDDKLARIAGVLHGNEPEESIQAALYTSYIKQKEYTAKESYFRYVRARTALDFRAIESKAGKEEEEKEKNKKRIREFLNTFDHQGVKFNGANATEAKLIASEEEMFAFLWRNMETIAPTELKQVLEEFFSKEDMPVGEANWKMAMALYTKVATAKETDWRFKLLLSYFLDRALDEATVTAKMDELKKEYTPFTLQQVAQFRMADGAITALQPGSQHREDGAMLEPSPRNGFNTWTFVDELARMFRATPITVDKLDGSESRSVAPDKAYDDGFLNTADAWAKEMREYYLRLTDEDEKRNLAKFVRKVSDFHQSVRGKLAQKGEVKLGESLKHSLEATAQGLHESAKKILTKGKPSKLARLIIGIGLAVLGLALLAVGVAAMFVCPYVVAGLGTAAAYATAQTGVAVTAANLSIGSLALGGAMTVGGGVLGFFGLPGSSAKVRTHTGRVIDFCKQAGIDACKPSDGGAPSGERRQLLASH